MSIRRRFPASTVLSTALLVLVAMRASLADDLAGKGARDEWHKIYLLGKPAGFIHISARPREGGGFVVSTAQKITMKRGAVPVETEGVSAVEEGPDGRLKGFQLTQKMSKETMETSGVLDGGAFAVTDTLSGKNPRKSQIALDADAVGSYRAEEIVRDKLKKAGDAMEVKIFIPEFRKFGKQKAVFEREEEVDLLGKKMTLRRVTVTIDALPGITTIEWRDEKNDVQKSSIALLGMEMVTYRSTAEEVLKESLSSPPEVFFSSSIPVDQKVRSDAKAVTYRLTSNTGAFPVKPGGHMFPGAGQKVVREDGPASRVLRVERVLPKEKMLLPLAPAPALEEFLRPNLFIQSDDKDIAEVAKKVAGSERDAWKTAKALEQWTFSNVKDKNLDTAFATAKEVLTTKAGDCTEHAVLLAALLRAVGLPSRVVAGVVYYDHAFVGHMWTEVHIGEWIPLDATRGQGSVGPDHIALSVSSLDSASIGDVFLDIVPVIGNVKVAVLESVD